MNILKMLFSVMIISIIALACQQETTNETLIFDIDQAKDTIDFDVSQIFKSGQMVRLENSTDAMIGRITALEISDNYIVLYNFSGRILLFNRQGEFLRFIGQKGQGPFEYKHVNGLAFSEEQNLILADRAYDDDFVGYSIDGQGLFRVRRANKGSHLFELLESKTILSIGYHSVPWMAGITDSINLYHLDTDGIVSYSESPIKESYQIRVGGIPIPHICYPFKESIRIHFGQDTLFSYNPGSHELNTEAVFTSSSRGFDYHEIQKKIENETSKLDDHLGHTFVEVHAESEDLYLLHGTEIESYSIKFEGKTEEGISPKSIGYFVANKKTKKVDAVHLVDPYWGINLQKDAYAIPFNKLNFSDNKYAYFAYDAIDFKEDVSTLIEDCVDPVIQQKLADLDKVLSEEDNTILFIYELKL